jgi:hypothetical protein
MQPTGGSVDAFLAAVAPAKRRRDADSLVAMMREVTGREPAMWGTIVGFGQCHYRYPTGTEGEMPLLSFAPRRASTTVYVDAAARHTDALAALGPHTSSVSCLYIPDVAAVDAAVLRGILGDAYAFTTSGGDESVSLTVTD